MWQSKGFLANPAIVSRPEATSEIQKPCGKCILTELFTGKVVHWAVVTRSTNITIKLEELVEE